MICVTRGGNLVLKNPDTTLTIICEMDCITYSRAELKQPRFRRKLLARNERIDERIKLYVIEER